jgi:hypothetical protein
MNNMLNLLIKTGSAILIGIIWLLVIPNFVLIFPFTGRFLHEYDFTDFPYEWYCNTKNKIL